MKQHPFSQGVLTDNTDGIGPVTRALVQERAHELAGIAERASPLVSPADCEPAKHELTGEADPDRQDALPDTLSVEQRWDPVPGSTGRQAPESPSEDEDDEGPSATEQLVDEGAIEAARDHQFAANRLTGQGVRRNSLSHF